MNKKLLSALAIAWSTNVFAGVIGVVDIEKLLDKTSSYSKAKKSLEKEVTDAQASLQKLQKKIEDATAALEKNAAAMKPEALAAAKDQIAKDQNDYTTKQMEAQRSLYQKNQDALNAAFETIRTTTEAVAKEQGVELVLPKNEVVYFAPASDITDKVIAKLK
jgi:Skp family chaperone for outer membrane proteins